MPEFSSPFEDSSELSLLEVDIHPERAIIRLTNQPLAHFISMIFQFSRRTAFVKACHQFFNHEVNFFLVLCLLKENRTVTWLGSLLIALRTCEPWSAPLVQALPPLAHILIDVEIKKKHF
jgi:hypothetical protein